MAVGGCTQTYTDYSSFIAEPRPIVTATDYRMAPPDTVQVYSKRVREIHLHTEAISPDGKITLPLIHAIANAPDAVVDRIRRRMVSGDLDGGGAAEVVAFAAEYGGLDYARQRARGYADRALELLDAFEDTPVRATLHDAVEYVLDRRQ